MTSVGQSAETVAKEPQELIRLRAENRLLKATLKQRNEEIAALKATLKQRTGEITAIKQSTDEGEAVSAMDERIRKAYRADPTRPLLSALEFEDRKVTRTTKGSYEMVVVCSIVYPDRPTQRDRTRWHIRATHGPNGWQAELASLPEAP